MLPTSQSKALPSFLSSVLNDEPFHNTSQQIGNFSFEYLATGVVCLTPAHYHKAVVISAGIHGNETAPIEILEQIYQDILTHQLALNVRLLLVLGNPQAIRQGGRFTDYDINRLFCGGHRQLEANVETLRAEQLEQLVADFFAKSLTTAKRYHYDLHTAIRGSLLPTFALLPYQIEAYDEELLDALNAADLDAVVYHNSAGRTFTHFTASSFAAASATLELGQAKAFGNNNLSQFLAIDKVLRAIISGEPLPPRDKVKVAIRTFKVMDSIIKRDEDFVLKLTADALNFSQFESGATIATQSSQNYVATGNTYILFPNPNVAMGLRAGLMLTEVN